LLIYAFIHILLFLNGASYFSIENNSEEPVCFDLDDENNRRKQRYLVPSNATGTFIKYHGSYVYFAECDAKSIELKRQPKFFFLDEMKFVIDENGEISSDLELQ